jgi:NAD(P)-dependent dehydrogenase (short-subunit alcohol dehydrogenase family)
LRFFLAFTGREHTRIPDLERKVYMLYSIGHDPRQAERQEVLRDRRRQRHPATALAAAAQGAELFLTDRDERELEATVEAIQNAGGRVALYRALDVSDFEAVRSFADEIHAASGAMDVVMNIAGISVWGTVDKLEHKHWRKVIEINLMGPIHVIECLLPEMIRAGRGGHLVNVSSAAGLFGLPWHAAYSASKFGLRGISEVLRFDLERHGIAVSLVCPGGVDTGLVRTLEIVGVDRSRPELARATRHFRKRAVSAEAAAAAILRGMHRGDYLVFTSPDVRIGYWFSQKLSFVYEWAIRRRSGQMERMAELRGEPRKSTGFSTQTDPEVYLVFTFGPSCGKHHVSLGPMPG